MFKLTLRSALLALTVLLLNSCGGNPWGLNLSFTDSPIDTALGVNVSISNIEFVKSNGTTLNSAAFDPPTSVDIFTYQGGLAIPVLQDLEIGIGNYTAINVTLSTDPLSALSSVTEPDGSHILYVPPGNAPQPGTLCSTPSPTCFTIPVNFSIASDTETNVTIDFDLRKSIIQDPNDPTKYILIPSMRAVVNELSGSITGSVDSSLISEQANCIQGMAVYAYVGNVTPTDVDIGSTGTQPISTALVGLNATSGQYNFTLAFLPPGPYTLAFTCQANLDIANQVNPVSIVPPAKLQTSNATAIQFTSVTKSPIQVTANQTTFVALTHP